MQPVCWKIEEWSIILDVRRVSRETLWVKEPDFEMYKNVNGLSTILFFEVDARFCSQMLAFAWCFQLCEQIRMVISFCLG
jgi:hypothetical protein